MPPQQPKEAVADHVQPTMPMPNSPVNHSSSGAMVYGNSASVYPSASMAFNGQGEFTGFSLKAFPACLPVMPNLMPNFVSIV